MGQRSASETLATVVVAFTKRRLWSQADLARETGVMPRTIRKTLQDLTTAGWPFEQRHEHPHSYWSVPRDWFPGGVVLDAESIAALVQVLMRVPASPARQRLLDVVKRHAPPFLTSTLDRIVPPKTTSVEEQLLPRLMEAFSKQTAVSARYFSVSKGTMSQRTLSIQRVLLGPPTRVVAYCHTAAELRWFRLESFASLHPAGTESFHPVDDDIVEELVQTSVDGYHGAERVHLAFHVADPEARWVEHNLPDGLRGVRDASGLLVEAETAGLLPVSRFVVGLGAAARCLTPELEAKVRELARGALGS